jgi:hypothetical protein
MWSGHKGCGAGGRPPRTASATPRTAPCSVAATPTVSGEVCVLETTDIVRNVARYMEGRGWEEVNQDELQALYRPIICMLLVRPPMQARRARRHPRALRCRRIQIRSSVRRTDALTHQPKRSARLRGRGARANALKRVLYALALAPPGLRLPRTYYAAAAGS